MKMKPTIVKPMMFLLTCLFLATTLETQATMMRVDEAINYLSPPMRGWRSQDPLDTVANQYIVKFKPSAKGMMPVKEALARFKFINAALVNSETSSIDPDQVEYIEPNYILKADGTPNDPDFSKLWGLKKIGLETAWDRITSSSEIVIAIIDSGIDYTHPDLVANMWKNPGEIPGNGIDDDGNGYIDDVYGFDFANGDGDPLDDFSHGTHCAGTIAAVGNNGIGVVGVNWTAKLMALKFLDKTGHGDTAKAIAAIEYAIQMKAKILSNSWGRGEGRALKDAIQSAQDRGILFVAAAGNETADTDTFPHYPASYDLDNIISVTATDQNDNWGTFSNYGAISVDLAAPGVDIYSTLPGGAYGYKEGTSMATPHVTGVAALVWAANPTFTYQQVKDRILTSVDPIAALKGKTVTGGRLNAYQALTGTPTGVPIASCTASGDGMKVTFDGTTSRDTNPGGYITSYRWIFSGPADTLTSGDKITTKDLQTPGTYVATLTVTDNDNLTGEAKCNVTVPIQTHPIGSAPVTADFEEVSQSSSDISGETLPSCQCTWTICKKSPYGGCDSIGSVKEGCKFSGTFDSEGTYWVTPALTCGGKPASGGTPRQVDVLPALGGVFAGGVSINQGSYQTKVVQKLADVMEIVGEIKSPAHINQIVDIVVYAHYYIPEGKLFFMVDTNGVPLPWDGNPANLVAFKSKVPLTSPHLVEMYKGQLIPGHLLGYLGYRLADGTLVTSNNPIDITINQ
jgi:subtilisin family serine protease